eukprot:c11816_g3_i1.p1 GENE.c11816_g3_i1~~c11816_g3_i1.p1  ORF type:complete len:338 (+),score=84.54 c11816_g3_i1:89-1102(+)
MMLNSNPFGMSPNAIEQQQQLLQGTDPEDLETIHHFVLDISNPEKREVALLELSKKREMFPGLAPILWYSFGTISALLQEIVGIYPLLSPPQLSAAASNRVCNSLALLQCVASHQETRRPFLHAHIPLFLYPFLNTVTKTKAFEYLRLTSLGVIGALVKVDDANVISFLLTTEIIPLCLRIMESGSDLSKTVATFIIQKILNDDTGLNYVCHTPERFHTVISVLGKMVNTLAKQPAPHHHTPSLARLLKHIIRCFYRLSEHPSACNALLQYLPSALTDGTFASVIKDDTNVKRWLHQLLKTIGQQQHQQQQQQMMMGHTMAHDPTAGLVARMDDLGF